MNPAEAAKEPAPSRSRPGSGKAVRARHTPRRKAEPPGSEAGLEESRTRQRAICAALLEKWVPLATAEALAVQGESRGKPVLEEEAFETGLKAGAFVLKVLERLARLDGLDAAERKEVTVSEFADPLELARRIRVVSPVLLARLEQAVHPLVESPALPVENGKPA